jgi:hypothetical protein
VHKKLPLEALYEIAGAGAAVHRFQRVKQFSQREGRPVVHKQARFIPDDVSGEKRF